jgi:hypothetical protein
MTIEPTTQMGLNDSRRSKIWPWLTVGLAGLGVGLGALRVAHANGIPASGALVYSGILTDGSGNPLASPQSLGIAVYDSATGGRKVCEQSPKDVDVDVSGRFQVSMPDACVAAIAAQPELWVEVSVAGSSLGRSKIGAVPYAVEAGDAARLQGKEPSDLAVPSGMIGMFASACPSGWSLTDGTNGTPDLIGNYAKAGAAFATSTGSNTHSHSLTGTTSNDGHHHHYLEFNWDYGTLTPAGDASLYTNYQAFDSTVVDDEFVSQSSWTSDGRLDLPGAAGHNDTTYVHNGGSVTTSVGDHHHSVTGTTDAQSHEPKHVTLVFCRKD